MENKCRFCGCACDGAEHTECRAEFEAEYNIYLDELRELEAEETLHYEKRSA